MKKSLVIIVLVLVLFTVVTCSFSKIGEIGRVPGEEKLAGKTPKELYEEAKNYIKELTNYEIVIDATYKYTYYEVPETDAKGESKETKAPVVQEEKNTTVYKAADKTVACFYERDGYKEHLIYDGTMLYQSFNNIREKKKIAYDAFVKEYGNFVESDILIPLEDSNFDKVRFVPKGEFYVLDFVITPEQYKEIVGGSVDKAVEYKVYFDSNGVIQKFERSMEYYYYESILVHDIMIASFKNIGKTAKITAPTDADKYDIRPLAADIDTTPVKNLDGFKETDQETDYALITFKMEPNTAGTETDADAKEKDIEPYEGKILIRLYPDVAPATVANFRRLIGQSTYKGLVVNGIIEDFAIQIGEPISDKEEENTENVFDYIFGEFESNGFTNNLSHKRGVVSMLRGEDPNSATYDFFICAKDATELDGYYASFGCVIYGFETIDKIAEIEVDKDYIPKATVTITDTRFLAKK